MNKSLAFEVGWCISSFVFLMVSIAATEGRPGARAVTGIILILCFFLATHFIPVDSKRETSYHKFVFGLEIIIMLLTFLILIATIGMVQESLVEAGYVSSDVMNYVPESP